MDAVDEAMEALKTALREERFEQLQDILDGDCEHWHLGGRDESRFVQALVEKGVAPATITWVVFLMLGDIAKRGWLLLSHMEWTPAGENGEVEPGPCFRLASEKLRWSEAGGLDMMVDAFPKCEIGITFNAAAGRRSAPLEPRSPKATTEKE